MGLRLLIFHFRVGKEDGVSLEIANWKQILEGQGHQVLTAAGSESAGADWTIEHLENQRDARVYDLDQQAFSHCGEDFENRFGRHQEDLKREFERVIREATPDRVIISNIWSVGENLAAAGALLDALTGKGITVVAVHHDFYWENRRYRSPGCELVREQLKKYFPPKADFIRHVCINSLARAELVKRKEIAAVLLPDCLDFNHPEDSSRSNCKAKLTKMGIGEDDLVVLQATRVVRRKNIELAMDIVAGLQKKLTRKLVFVMRGYTDRRQQNYLNCLRQYARDLGISVVEVQGERNGIMSLYPCADVITYPSVYEGFGNQLLEAVYARKPVVMYEYPVYEADIKPLGFEVISLGSKMPIKDRTWRVKLPEAVITKAVDELEVLLKDDRRREEMVDRNYRLAGEYFSFERIREIWKELLN